METDIKMAGQSALLAQEAAAAAVQGVRREILPVAQQAAAGLQREAGDERLRYGRWLVQGGGSEAVADARLALASFYCRRVYASQQEDPENPGVMLDGTAVEFCGGFVRVSGVDRIAMGMVSEASYIPNVITVFIPGLVAGVSTLYGVWVKLEIGSYTGDYGPNVSAAAGMEYAALEDELTTDGFPESEISYSDGWPEATIIFPLVTVGYVYGTAPQVVHRLHVGGDLVFGQGLNAGFKYVQASRYNPDESRMEEMLRKVSVIGGAVLMGENEEEWTAMENGDVVPCPDPEA